MKSSLSLPAEVPNGALSDAQIVHRVRSGDHALFEILMRRHNQRLYRAARAVVRDEHEVEDVMQQAYLNAFRHLDQFEERSQLSTWLTRITLNEAFARRRKMQQTASEGVPARADARAQLESAPAAEPNPERQAYAQELGRVLELAVDELPDNYRVVFMLRDVEGLSTSEAGECLGLGEEAVKTRLHRARAMIRRAVSLRIGSVSAETFQFYAPRCDRVVSRVLAQVARV